LFAGIYEVQGIPSTGRFAPQRATREASSRGAEPKAVFRGEVLPDFQNDDTANLKSSISPQAARRGRLALVTDATDTEPIVVVFVLGGLHHDYRRTA
jgi:hypothetical protein